MSEQPAATGQGPVIARAGKRKWGYDTAQVDEFLARAHTLYEAERPQLTQRDIQAVSFDLVKDGYAIAQVDAALSRLERAVVDKHTSWELAHGGRVPFKVRSEEMLAQLANHGDREPRHRFKDGEAKKPSYDRKQVDRVVDQVIAKASSALEVQGALPPDSKELLDVTASRVANVIFTQRKGKRGYDERAVDYYLDVAVQLLSRLESFARISDYSADAAESAPAAVPLETASPAPAAFAPQVPAAAAPAPVSAAPAASAQPAAAPFAAVAQAASSIAPAARQAVQTAQQAQAVPSLFAAASATGVAAAAGTAAASAAASASSAALNAHAAAERESFDALNAAERSIFAARPASSAVPAAATAPAAPVAQQPAPLAPASAVAETPAPAVAPVSASIAEAPSLSSSLAALAQSVPQHTAAASVESAPTEAIAPVDQPTVAETPAPVPVHVTVPTPAVAAQPTAAQSAVVPEPAAPAASAASAPVSSPAPLIPEPAPAVASSPVHAETPAVQSFRTPSLSPIAAPAPLIAEPVVEHVTAAPKDDAAPDAAPADADAKSAKKDDTDPDQYLANLLGSTAFPKIDLDIPNLSFPSLSEDGDDIIDTPKTNGDQQSR